MHSIISGVSALLVGHRLLLQISHGSEKHSLGDIDIFFMLFFIMKTFLKDKMQQMG